MQTGIEEMKFEHETDNIPVKQKDLEVLRNNYKSLHEDIQTNRQLTNKYVGYVNTMSKGLQEDLIPQIGFEITRLKRANLILRIGFLIEGVMILKLWGVF